MNSNTNIDPRKQIFKFRTKLIYNNTASQLLICVYMNKDNGNDGNANNGNALGDNTRAELKENSLQMFFAGLQLEISKPGDDKTDAMEMEYD